MNTTMIYTIWCGSEVLTIQLRNNKSLVETVLKEKDHEFVAIVPTQLSFRGTQ